MDKATGMVERMASTAPIFAWYSTRALQEWWSQALEKFGKASWINLNFSWWNAGKLKADEKFRKKLDKLAWVEGRRYETDYDELTKSNNFIWDTKNMIIWLNQESFSKRESILNKKLRENKNIWIDEIDKDKNRYFWDTKELKTLKSEWFKLLHEKLWWKSWDEPTTYDWFLKLIKENHYHPKKD